MGCLLVSLQAASNNSQVTHKRRHVTFASAATTPRSPLRAPVGRADLLVLARRRGPALRGELVDILFRRRTTLHVARKIIWRPSPMYGSRRSAWPFLVKLCEQSPVSELIDMRGSSGGRTVPKQCRSVAERYEFWWSVEPEFVGTGSGTARSRRPRIRNTAWTACFPRAVVAPRVSWPHAARHAIFIRVAAARRRAAVAGVSRRLAAAAVLVKAVGRADAAPRVGDGARRRAVRVRAAGVCRGRARRLAGGEKAPAAAHDWRHDRRRRGGGRRVAHDCWHDGAGLWRTA